MPWDTSTSFSDSIPQIAVGFQTGIDPAQPPDGSPVPRNRPARGAPALATRLYQADSRFLYGVFCFSEDPQRRTITVVSGSSGLPNSQVRDCWQLDFPAVQVRVIGGQPGGLDGAVHPVRPHLQIQLELLGHGLFRLPAQTQLDFPAVQELAGGLDTAVGFLEQDGRVYLVRNLMESR